MKVVRQTMSICRIPFVGTAALSPRKGWFYENVCAQIYPPGLHLVMRYWEGKRQKSQPALAQIDYAFTVSTQRKTLICVGPNILVFLFLR